MRALLATATLLALSALSSLSAQSTIFVELTGSDTLGNGTPGSPYRTVAFAASVANPFQTIQVGAGTFDDPQILIGANNLAIVGSGMGVTTLVPPATGVSLDAGFLPGAPTLHVAGVAIVGGGRVSIRNLTIDGANRVPATGRLVGVYAAGDANVTLDRVEIIGCRNAPLAGNQRAAAIIVRGDGDLIPVDVYLRQCVIRDWGKAGVVGFFDDAQIRMEYCSVLGAGPTPVVAQNCVQLSYGATGELTYNTIADARYTGGGFDSAGILLFDAGTGSRLFVNDIARCDNGVAIVNQSLGGVDVKLEANRITASTSRAIRVQNATGVEAIENRFHTADLSVLSAFDSTSAGNLYSGNSYSDYSGFGSYLIEGGPNKDLTPRNGIAELNGATSVVALSGMANDVLVADLDGAAGLDLAAITGDGTPRLNIALSDGLGGYTVADLPFASSAAKPERIVTGEFDGVPGTDLAVVTSNNPPAQTQNRVYVFSNNGSGAFSLLTVVSLIGAFDPSDIAAADVDSDGFDDLAVSFRGAAPLLPGGGLVLLNTAAGTSFTQTILPGVTGRCGGVAIGNIVNGQLDIVLAEGDGLFGATHVFGNDGLGGFTLAATLGSVDDPQDVGLVDIDDDGDLDILVVGRPGGNLTAGGQATVITNSWPTFSTTSLPLDRDPRQVLVADLDNDDDPDTVRTDALVVTPGGTDVTVLGAFENGLPTRGGLAVVRDGLGFSITPAAAGAGDLNGDGFADLVVADQFASELRVVLAQPSARADRFGFACAGSFGRIPRISASGTPPTPTVPNPTFGIRLTNGVQTTLGALVISVAPAPTLTPCTLQVNQLGIVATPGVITDVFGRANLLLGVPNDPSLIGGDSLAAQWILLDPNGGFVGPPALGLSLSDALRIRIGVL